MALQRLLSLFKCEYYAFVDDESELERAAHQMFANNRPNKNREYFEVSIPEAITGIRSLAEARGGIRSEKVLYTSPQEILAHQRALEEDHLTFEKCEANRARLEQEQAKQNRINAIKEKINEENAKTKGVNFMVLFGIVMLIIIACYFYSLNEQEGSFISIILLVFLSIFGERKRRSAEESIDKLRSELHSIKVKRKNQSFSSNFFLMSL